MLKIVDETDVALYRKAQSVELDTGEIVEINEGPRGQHLRVLSGKGEVIFEYDPQSGKSRVTVPTGDLELISAQGDIELSSARDIRLRATRAVEIDSGVSVRLGAGSSDQRSAVELLPNRLRLSGATLSLLGKRATVQLEELFYSGKRLRGSLETAKLTFGKLELAADTVRQRAKNVYQKVEGLLQTHAGRGRATYTGSYHHKSHDVYLKAQRDAKIDGEQIHLG